MQKKLFFSFPTYFSNNNKRCDNHLLKNFYACQFPKLRVETQSGGGWRNVSVLCQLGCRAAKSCSTLAQSCE